MSKLLPIVINAPGSNGLNLEQEFQLQSPEWLTEAKNCILTYNGRVGSRKGWVPLTQVAHGTVELLVTVEDAGDSFIGYSSGQFTVAWGSISPATPAVGSVTIDILSQVQSNFQIRFLDGATMPADLTTIIVETASGDVELDAQNPTSIGSSNRYSWSGTYWTSGDDTVIRSVRFT